MERNSLVVSADVEADSPGGGGGGGGGVDNGLEMRPLGPASSSEEVVCGPKTPPPTALPPLVVREARCGTPEFPGAPPSSPMQVTAPGGGFGENSETIQSEGVRNLVQELQQMSHAQRQLQALRQQQLLEEQQQLEAQLPSGGPMSASGQQLYLAAQSEAWPNIHAAPPDGGYGWLVVLCCFLCMVAVDGISFGFGILMSPIQETFDSGKGCVSLAGALLTGFYLLVGPLTSALCSRFSYRQVTIFGSLLSTVAMVSASYAQKLPLFLFLYGVLGGTGFGVIYITCFSVVGAWFQRKRALATGTVVCGTGIGLAIIGVVGPLLLRGYSWRGTLVVFACVMLQGCVCGAAFRPAQMHQRILREDEARRVRKEAKRKAKEQEAKSRAHARAQNGVDRGSKSNGAASQKTGGDASERRPRRRRKLHSHRCSIMQKIIEDKERQRTVSSGSLNGCIITQDNQLIQPPDDYSESPRISQTTLNRIVETIKRRGPGSDSRSRSRQNSLRLAKEMPMMVANYVNQSNQQQQQQQQQATGSKSNDVSKDATGQSLVVNGPSGGSSLPASRAPSAAASRHNSAASLFHSVEREASGAMLGGSSRAKCDPELQRPLLLQLDSVTATSSGAATPSIAASSATPAPALTGRRLSARRSPSGSLHCSGSFAQLPPALGPVAAGVVRTSSLLASPTSDSRLPSRQNSFLVQGVPHPSAVGGYTAEDLAYLEQPPLATRRDPVCCSGVVVDACWQMLTPSILKSPTFLLITASSMFTMFGFLIPNMLLVDYATSLAMPTDKAALLITYLGVANTVGRICTVIYITNVLGKERPLIGSLSLNNFTLVLSGLITILLPFAGAVFYKEHLYQVFISYSVIYGFSIAVFVSMRGFIVDEMLGADSLTNAFGYLLLFQGLAVIIGPPLSGWLVDIYGGYREAFCLGGSAVLLSGLLLLPLRRLALWEKQRNTLAQIDDFEVASAATGEPGAYTPVGAFEAVTSSAANFYGSANSCTTWSAAAAAAAAPQPPPTPV